MVLLGGLCITVSVVGLYILLFSSFKTNEKNKNSGNSASRKIRAHRENNDNNNTEDAKPNPKFILLLETIFIAEGAGLFFLWLTHDPMKFSVIAINGVAFLVASFLCSILTLINAWFKKKMHLVFRIILQLATLVTGILLLRFSTNGKAEMPTDYVTDAYFAFFITVVIALLTMLFNVVIGNKEEEVEFNYNIYLLVVIASGMIIGSSLYLAKLMSS